MRNFSEKKIKEIAELEIMKIKSQFYDEYSEDEETNLFNYEFQIIGINRFIDYLLKGE